MHHKKKNYRQSSYSPQQNNYYPYPHMYSYPPIPPPIQGNQYLPYMPHGYPYPNYPPANIPQYPQIQYKLSFQDKLDLIQQLKYGEKWSKIKQRILPYEYDFKGYDNQNSQNNNFTQYKPELQQKTDKQLVGQRQAANKIDNQHVKNNQQKKKIAKAYNYRILSKGNKKIVIQNRLRQKYEQCRKENPQQVYPKQNYMIPQKNRLNRNKFSQKNIEQEPVSQYDRYFSKPFENCKKCIYGKHQKQHCVQSYFCMICLAHTHDSKNCCIKNICTICHELGHKTQKCPQNNNSEKIKHCTLCSRMHSFTGQTNQYCYSLTKGKQENTCEIRHQLLKDLSQIQCLRCYRFGHLKCPKY